MRSRSGLFILGLVTGLGLGVVIGVVASISLRLAFFPTNAHSVYASRSTQVVELGRELIVENPGLLVDRAAMRAEFLRRFRNPLPWRFDDVHIWYDTKALLIATHEGGLRVVREVDDGAYIAQGITERSVEWTVWIIPRE